MISSPNLGIHHRGPPIGMNMDQQKTLNLYMDYIQAFENKDYDSIANVCRTPFFVSSPSGTIIFGNREELMEGFSLLRGSLDVDGYVGSKLNSLDFTIWQKHQERFWWILTGSIKRVGPISMQRPCISSKGKPQGLYDRIVLDDTTASSLNN